MMNSHLLRTLSLIICIFPICAFSQSEVHKDDDTSLKGPALSVLMNSQPMVTNAMNFCTQEIPSFSPQGEAVITAWNSRNGKYLSLREPLLLEMRAQAINLGLESEWIEFESKTIPKHNQLISNLLVNVLKMQPKGQELKDKCEFFAKSIDLGLVDFASEDPKVAAFLKKRLMLLESKQN